MRAIPTPLLRYLSGLARCPTSAPATDAELLDCFVSRGDEDAFAVLVARHGPMVLRLCRRVLGNAQDAEDTFQATFLVLARKAGSIRRRHHLAAWLHGAACRLALKARAAQARRRLGEVSAPAPEPPDPQPDPLTRMTARELLTALDEELGRLPEAYRLPLVMCCLEGRTQDEAARLLGWTPGSVKGRLERGRARLQARLARRGLALSAALLALEALHGPATAGLPAARLTATAQAALRFAAGARSAAGGTSQAITLAEGALKAMLMTKLIIATAVLLVAACVGMGVGGLALRSQAAGEEAESKGGAPVGGGAPSEKDGTVKRLKLTLSADKTETWMQPDGKNAVPVKLKLTFTNDIDKPTKLDAYVLQWRMGFRCDGPTAESVKTTAEYIERPANFLPPRVAEDSPVLQPGKSWSPGWTRSFPGDIEEGYGKAIDYALLKPGTYKLRVTLYENPFAGAEGEKRAKWLESNELELKVREKDTAGPAKPDKERGASDRDKLQGMWPAVSREGDGKADADAVKAGLRLTVEGNRFTLRPERALHFPHGTFTLDTSQQPKALDFTQKVGLAGEEPQLIPGIYEVDGATLKICRAISGRTRPTDFTAKAGSGRELLVFRRPAAGGTKQDAPAGTKARFEALVGRLKFFPTSALSYGRGERLRLLGPIPEESTEPWYQIHQALSADKGAVADLVDLLKHDDPKVRTLALAALFLREDPTVLPHFAAMLGDTGKTAPNLEIIRSNFSQQLMPQDFQEQTVGQVAQGLLDSWLRPAEFAPKEFAAYWADRKDRKFCASWYLARFSRAGQATSDFDKKRAPLIRAIRKEVDSLDPIDRDWTLLWLSANSLCSASTEPQQVLASAEELLAAGKRLGPARLMDLLQDRPISRDPDLAPGQRRSRGRHDLILWVLRHAGPLLRPEDAPAILALETNLPDRTPNPWCAIAAAELQPARARTWLREALGRFAKNYQSSARAQLAAGLWRSVGESEIDYLADWFYGEKVARNAGTPPAEIFLSGIKGVRAPADRKLVARLIRDPRLEKLDYESLRVLVQLVGGWTKAAVVPAGDLYPMWERSGHPETPRDEMRLAEWRDKLKKSVAEWNH